MKKAKKLWALLLCMLLCVGLLPTTVFATGDPVITNLTVTRDSETTATITFDSTQAGSVAIGFKNSDGTLELYIGDKDGVTVGKNVIQYEYLEGSDAKEIAVYFGTDESDFDAFMFEGKTPFDMPDSVRGNVPVVHTCTAQGDWQYDPYNHWKLCGVCNNKVDEAAHSGGTATCTAPAVCETCQQAYGSANSDNHTGKIVWTQTETTHSSAYDCCGAAVVAEESHTYEWVTDKEPTATEAGSRHEECKVCGYVGATETIAATGTTETPSDTDQTEETPSDDTTDDKTIPETGDTSNLALWITLLVLASVGMFGTTVLSRKHRIN